MPPRSIELGILRYPHPSTLHLPLRLEGVRVVARVSLRASSDWTKFRSAIVDTGAPLSVFPRRFWREAECTTVGEAELRGLVRFEAPRSIARVAEVLAVLSDGRASSTPFRMPAYLVENDQVPAVLGFAGCLDRFRLVIDVQRNQANAELPG